MHKAERKIHIVKKGTITHSHTLNENKAAVVTAVQNRVN